MLIYQNIFPVQYIHACASPGVAVILGNDVALQEHFSVHLHALLLTVSFWYTVQICGTLVDLPRRTYILGAACNNTTKGIRLSMYKKSYVMVFVVLL